jgi:hypothetical protein
MIPTRRRFLQQSAAVLAAIGQSALARGAKAMKNDHPICVTCGTQFAESERPPARCPICEDERQYVGWKGQEWTTLEEMQGKFHNRFEQEEAGVTTIHTESKFGIGQRALLIHTGDGNILWDSLSLIDEPTITQLRQLGGIAAIAISHPHYYSSMVEFSRAFGGAPIYLHEADAKWVMRPDRAIHHWQGSTKPLFGGMTLINTGGHFAGFQVLHWASGAEGRGILFSGDQPQVCMDRRWVSFMYSYPNLIPLSPPAIRRIVNSLEPFDFARLYGAFPHYVVATDAHGAVKRSAERYLHAIT